MSGSRKAGSFGATYGVFIAFLILYIAGALWKPALLFSPEGIRNLFNQNADVGMLAVGMTLVIIAGGIDLSVGSMMAMIGAFCLKIIEALMRWGVPDAGAIAFSALLCVVIGLASGLLNGLLITVGRIAPFIATLAGLVCYRSISLVLGDGGEIRSPTAMLGDFGQSGIPLPGVTNNAGRPLDLPWSVIAFVLVAVLGHYVLTRTRLGRYFVAVGANERAAAYSAIPVARVKTLSYVILGGFVGLAAFLLTARFNSVSTSQMGQLDELDAIAAVVIGGTSMAGGSGRIWGTFVGVLILGVINTLLVGTVSPYWQGMVKGLIILLAVLIQREQARR